MAGYFGVKAEESVLQDMLGLFYCLKFHFEKMSVGAKFCNLNYFDLSTFFWLISVFSCSFDISPTEESIFLQMMDPKGDLWVQSPMIIVGQSPNIRSIGDLPKRIVGLCPLGRA